MLGLTLECARCHDHKFDPITQRDYFSLFAFFNNIDESGLYSHFTNATPTPTLRLWTDAQTRRRRDIEARLGRAEAQVREARESARAAFAAWRTSGQVVAAAPIAHVTFDADPPIDRVLGTTLKVEPGLAIVGDTAGALRFDGDTALVHPGVRAFQRSNAFSIALRLQPTVNDPRAVLVHQSRAWSDAGSRGFELTLDHGRPFFALVHFWPGNAIAIRAREPLPTGAWSQLVATYDGSSRATGLALYLNGARLDTEIVRDHLYKDIDYNKALGDNSADSHPLTLGARFRDSGFREGLIDDLQIYDVGLTGAEVRTLAPSPQPSLRGRGEAEDGALFEYFVERVHERSRRAIAARQVVRREESALASAVSEIMVMEEMPAERPAFLLARGAYDAPRDRVTRGTPASLPPFPADAPRNRLGLARWLTDRSNPLAARVVVNRLWRMHFGRGLVATQEDFGSQGRLPTHPELLDWLAARFVESGWNVEGAAPADPVVRDVSAVVGRLARGAPARSGEPAASRGPLVRLQAEQIRDSALAASGLLTRSVGGRSVKPYQPRWPVGTVGHRQDLQGRHRRRALSPQPLHVLAADIAAAVDARLRRDVARSMHGEARDDVDAAAGAGVAERPAVRRGGAGDGRAAA